MQIKRASRLCRGTASVVAPSFQMTARACVCDSFGDGFWTVSNQGNNEVRPAINPAGTFNLRVRVAPQ